jgi:hypothetical protein
MIRRVPARSCDIDRADNRTRRAVAFHHGKLLMVTTTEGDTAIEVCRSYALQAQASNRGSIESEAGHVEANEHICAHAIVRCLDDFIESIGLWGASPEGVHALEPPAGMVELCI